MTTMFRPRVAAGMGSLILAFAISQNLLAEAAQPAAAPAPAPAQPASASAPAQRAAASAPAQPAAAPAQPATVAAETGTGIPLLPALPDAPAWLSYDQMQDRMKRFGVKMPAIAEIPFLSGMPAPPAPTTESVMAPPLPMGHRMSPDEQRRIFDVVEAMTPEQQEACFAMSRWHAPTRMKPRMMRGPMIPGRFPFRPRFGPPQRPAYPPMARPPR